MKNTVRLNTLKYKNAEDSAYLKELHASPEYWKKEYEKQIKKQRKDEGHFDEDKDKKS